MMEVKQNTAVDLNDFLTSTKNSGTDEVDDAVMTDLSDRTDHDLVNCDLIKKNDGTSLEMDLAVENGDAAITSLIKDVDVDVDDVDVNMDINSTVNSELEDALLAEDDVLPEIPNNKSVEQTPTAADDILAEKAETSNSTTSSNNVRDPGDDLDTLLSKINDIVEDCIEKESDNSKSNALQPDETVDKIVESKPENNKEKEIVSANEEPSLTENPDLIEKEKSELPQSINNLEEDMVQSGTKENLTDKSDVINTNLEDITKELLNNIDEVATKENGESEKDENDAIQVDEENAIQTDEENAIQAEEDSSIHKDNKQLNESDTDVENITTDKSITLDKTEESNAEIVEESNNVSSNSNEVSEVNKTADMSTEPVEIAEATSSPKAVACDEIEKSMENNQDLTETVEKEPQSPPQSEQKTEKNTDPVASENVENDSDDEIVFYVDKPPETEKSKGTEEKSREAEMKTTTTTTTTTTEKSSLKETATSPEKKTTAQADDDVVFLLDDDDDEIDQVKEKKEPATTNEDVNKAQDVQKEPSTVAAVSADTNALPEDKKSLVVDNSDNARDDFATENANENEKLVEKTQVTETPEETNSNCSSSSNLLQEAKSVKNSVDEPTPEEVENDEEEDDGDVELIDSDLKDSETSDKIEDSEIAPPAKRMRLSEDGVGDEAKKQDLCEAVDEVDLNDSDKVQESPATEEKENNPESVQSTLKRSHEVIELELELDEKTNDSKASTESSSKKKKTESLKDDVIISEIIDVANDDKPPEDVKNVEDDKKDVKAVPSYEPIQLYPPPKFETLKSELPLSLDFLKKFRKSFNNMTKQDLEDLVLQKVVEAIIHRSEFSEMRDLIEKQEKIISSHRSKISELSKQFRDLEMVHNRVVKDIEQRNSQFIMPVKITRAVGLQVYIPNKKSLTESPASTTGPSNVLSSPQRPVSSQASSTTSTSLTPPQRLLMSSQTDSQPQQRTTATASSGSGSAGTVRRGCVQKITPIRPVPGANPQTSTSSSSISSLPYRNNPNHSPATQPRILNKNASTASSTTIQRSRYMGSNPDSQRMTAQQQISRTASGIPTSSQRAVSNAATQSKSTSNIATSVPRRSEPLSSQNSNNSPSSSIVDNYINTLTHLAGGNTAVSITPAKPKEKAVIDLTDEDETPGQAAAITAPVVTQIPGAQTPRRILPAPGSSNSQVQYGRSTASLGRSPAASQMANNKTRQMSSLQAQNKSSFTSISTPPGTSITRINVAQGATSAQRVKYSHPAPLPATPPQAFNPSWKLPPPRPTIRISNLDNGIVISWTMEESMDRHAECVSYQIYAYQETSGPPMVDSWRHVGDVKAMLLPMAVTLTQFQEGQRYYFAVRAVDCHQRYGPFSLPKTWS